MTPFLLGMLFLDLPLPRSHGSLGFRVHWKAVVATDKMSLGSASRFRTYLRQGRR